MPTPLLRSVLLATGFALQPPGPFHGGEPVARDGERWLALIVDADRAALVATTLQVRAVEDPLVDAPGQRSGREVTSPLPGSLMYLRGAGLRAGPVEQATVTGDAHGPVPRPAHAIEWRNARYRIDAQCDAAPSRTIDAQPQHDCRIVLGDGRRTQTLLTVTGYREPGVAGVLLDGGSAAVLFAGDLDRDGRLDLILDLSDHYNVSRPTLLLSSRAADGEIVGAVAQFEAVGC